MEGHSGRMRRWWGRGEYWGTQPPAETAAAPRRPFPGSPWTPGRRRCSTGASWRGPSRCSWGHRFTRKKLFGSAAKTESFLLRSFVSLFLFLGGGAAAQEAGRCAPSSARSRRWRVRPAMPGSPLLFLSTRLKTWERRLTCARTRTIDMECARSCHWYQRMRTYTCSHTLTHTHTYTCPHTHTHAHTHPCTCKHTHTNFVLSRRKKRHKTLSLPRLEWEWKRKETEEIHNLENLLLLAKLVWIKCWLKEGRLFAMQASDQEFTVTYPIRTIGRWNT